MRIIKFRACIPSIGKICFNGKGLSLRRIWRLDESYFNDDVIWLEYTGLKDKNGVEIYEGDIVKAILPERTGEKQSWNPESPDGISEEPTTVSVEKIVIGEVRINPQSGVKLLIRKVVKLIPAHQLDENAEDIEPLRYLKIRKNDEVIGNIYENKELLDG